MEQCYGSQGKGFNHTVVKDPTTTTATTKTTTTTTSKVIRPGRLFIERKRALEWLTNDDDDDDDSDVSNEPWITSKVKRLFKSASSELAEETKERRHKAFKKYEEYCEKRKFRLLSPRICPAIDKCKCGAC